jgi:hypothetical protein
MKIKGVFYLPIEDNNGRDLRVEIAEVEDELFARFDGYTFLGHIKGAFRMADASQSVDTHAAYVVVLDEADIVKLEEILLRFKSSTLQESIYLEIQRNVEFRFLQ